MDGHTHSTYSYDGKNTAREMAEFALAAGYGYLAVTDHCDFDCARLGGFEWSEPLDASAWNDGLTGLADEFRGRLYIARGAEFGYLAEANGDYSEFVGRYNPDVIINSVHLTEGKDLYSPEYFSESAGDAANPRLRRPRSRAYGAYLRAVRESLDAPYRFDVVGHLGYISRRAPYDRPALALSDSRELFIDILETVKNKGKALEINSNAGRTCDFLPSAEIFKAYRAIGGELVTFGSDAHTASRICDKLDTAEELLRSLGFRYLFVYKGGEPYGVKL
ncbi:MAG: histidinol-phosphatase HisJ family protein [Clostridiales bacterium]|jgi:histidinol-phosphatase (PHP family)|nr:histidinol-phosphatase HisJ family protein [Clostridiales bacterium]